MNDDVRIVLAGRAKAAHDEMLKEARSDGKTTINSSRLINWIVSDYFERFFQRRKKKLCNAHFNSRKCLLEAMKSNDPEAVRRALKETARNLAPANENLRSRKSKKFIVADELEQK